MSDTPQGPGWWQASDGKWYPPETAPAANAPGAAGMPGMAGGSADNFSFDVGACFTWAWKKFQENMQALLILGAVVGGLPFLIYLVASFTNGFFITTMLWLVGLIASFVLAVLTVQAGVEVANTGSLDQSQMFKIKANIGVFVLTSILFGIMAILGCFLLCIGLVIVYLLFGLWPYAVVEEGAGVVESLSRSKDLVLGPGLGNTFVPMLVFLIFSAGGGFLGRGNAFGGILAVFLAPFGALVGAYIFKGLKGEPVAA
jgi:hypothetical protein